MMPADAHLPAWETGFSVRLKLSRRGGSGAAGGGALTVTVNDLVAVSGGGEESLTLAENV